MFYNYFNIFFVVIVKNDIDKWVYRVVGVIKK